jgi:hypothetical protein
MPVSSSARPEGNTLKGLSEGLCAGRQLVVAVAPPVLLGDRAGIA